MRQVTWRLATSALTAPLLDMRTQLRSLVALFLAMSPAAPAAALYSQTNLVSDLPMTAAHQDANLVNPWGMSYAPGSPGSPFWVSDNGTGVSTLYTADGTPQSLVVTVPPSAGAPAMTTSAPTGQVFNGTSGFKINGNPALFLFATEDGTISGWNGGTAAVREVDNSAAGASYKGLALDTTATGPVLLAADFASGKIDTIGSDFKPITLGGNFTDPNLPSGFAPFNVASFGTSIYVSYAKKGAGIDDEPGVGNGFVDVFNTAGVFQQRLVSQGVLNSPWGMAIAPANFGEFSNALLVGNFGDGLIHAYNPATGQLLGTLESSPGNPIQIQGLWALLFGGGGTTNNGSTNTLFFTAGIPGPGAVEDHGLFGSLTAVPEPGTGAELALGTLVLALRARRRARR
jgi:uncharacterized protein (TIGR03118 family)